MVYLVFHISQMEEPKEVKHRRRHGHSEMGTTAGDHVWLAQCLTLRLPACPGEQHSNCQARSPCSAANNSSNQALPQQLQKHRQLC